MPAAKAEQRAGRLLEGRRQARFPTCRDGGVASVQEGCEDAPRSLQLSPCQGVIPSTTRAGNPVEMRLPYSSTASFSEPPRPPGVPLPFRSQHRKTRGAPRTELRNAFPARLPLQGHVSERGGSTAPVSVSRLGLALRHALRPSLPQSAGFLLRHDRRHGRCINLSPPPLRTPWPAAAPRGRASPASLVARRWGTGEGG